MILASKPQYALSLNNTLLEIQSAELIRLHVENDAATGAEAYWFKHILVQDTAYTTLMRQDRKRLHRLVAETLEQTFPEAGELAPRLAMHFAAGELHTRAAHYYALAAERARTRFANAEAQMFYRAGLAELEKSGDAPAEERIQLLEGLADLLTLQGHHRDALREYDAALALTEEPLTRARLIRKKGDVYQILLEFEQTAAEYEAAEKALGALDATQPRARWEEWIWIQLGAMNNFYWHGHWQQVRGLTERARPFVDQYGTPGIRATFLDRVEMMLARRNRYVMDDETRGLVVAMQEAADESGDPHHILNARFSMAFVDLRRRDLDQAESEFLWSIERARELGEALYELWSLTYLAVLYRYRGQVERVRETVNASFQVASAGGTPWYGAGMANLAWVALQENKLEETRRLAQDAIKIWEPFGELYPFKTLAYFPLLELARRANTLDNVKEYVREILNPTQEKLDDELVDALTRAQAALETCDSEKVHGELGAAMNLARALGYI